MVYRLALFIHFHHSHFREKLKQAQGGHIANIRDPIRRIHSCFIINEQTHKVETDNDPYLTLQKNNHISELKSPRKYCGDD